jgi:methylglutaconyl-CoA hydratase
MYTTLQTTTENNILTISLNRPEVHNAFDEVMIDEIKTAFQQASKDDNLRIVVLRGTGKSFCAGADLNWMRNVSTYTYEQNFKESQNLAECFYAIYTCSKPTIAVVHGAAMGGANGLLATCDIVLADSETTFSLSEVKIGLIPACISPYIIKRVGEARARELMLTGQRFKGEKAERFGLVSYSLPSEQMVAKLGEMIDLLISSGPKAVANCKVLIENVVNHLTIEESKEYTAQMIAKQRISAEGQEGMAAFLEKRKPNWNI